MSIKESATDEEREGGVLARRYSGHSIWYFSLCIADSWNCSASRALIYRPAGPLSCPRGSELSFAYSHGTVALFAVLLCHQPPSRSHSALLVLPPFPLSRSTLSIHADYRSIYPARETCFISFIARNLAKRWPCVLQADDLLSSSVRLLLQSILPASASCHSRPPFLFSLVTCHCDQFSDVML